MTDEELVKRLREPWDGGFSRRMAEEFEAADRIEALEAELHLMKTSGVAEVAVRNPSVMEYMKHWEGRAEAAEAKLAKAVEALRHAKLNMAHPDQMIDDTLAELNGGKR